MKYGTINSSLVNKPYIIGESSSQFNEDFYKYIEHVPNMHGTIVWSMYPHDNGKSSGNRIKHNDGFTLWYDNKNNKNYNILLRITNHFRRMQDLPIITQLQF